jgi:hypothetical protein
MKPVELIGYVDETHRLHAELPTSIPPGPIRIMLLPATEQDEERDWLELINHSWTKDWSDPREDIYT